MHRIDSNEIYPTLLMKFIRQGKVIRANLRLYKSLMNLLTLVLKQPDREEDRQELGKILAFIEPDDIARDDRDLFSVVNLLETHPAMCEDVMKMTKHQVHMINSHNTDK